MTCDDKSGWLSEANDTVSLLFRGGVSQDTFVLETSVSDRAVLGWVYVIISPLLEQMLSWDWHHPGKVVVVLQV